MVGTQLVTTSAARTEIGLRALRTRFDMITPRTRGITQCTPTWTARHRGVTMGGGVTPLTRAAGHVQGREVVHA